jgi:hypothetical protein
MKRWDALKNADLPALNSQLRAANLPELHIESGPHKKEDDGDEE